MQLFLIRHAHTAGDPSVNAAEWPLSARGLLQAQALAEAPFWRQVDHIVLSSEPKTRLTIEPTLAKYHLPVTVDGRFDEVRRGGWLEDYVAQVAQFFATPHMAPGKWESAEDALKRFLEGVEALIQQHPHDNVALVGHGLLLSLYRAHLLGRTHVHLGDWQALSFAAVAQVDPQKGRLVEDFYPITG